MSRRRVSRLNAFTRLSAHLFGPRLRTRATSSGLRVLRQRKHLEDRAVQAVIEVTRLSDGTLRSAIALLNTNDANALTLPASTIPANTTTRNRGGIGLETSAASIITNTTSVGTRASNSGDMGKGVASDDLTTDQRGAPRRSTMVVGVFQIEDVSLRWRV